jgi:hypothetical protein
MLDAIVAGTLGNRRRFEWPKAKTPEISRLPGPAKTRGYKEAPLPI